MLWNACILLLAPKPVQQWAITVHVAILALQACLVSPTRHLNPPTGNIKEIKDTEKWARINPHTKIGWNNFFTLSLMYNIYASIIEGEGLDHFLPYHRCITFIVQIEYTC